MAGLKDTFSSPLTEVGAVKRDSLGILRFGDGGKVYKYVQLKNTTATVVGASGSLVAYGAATGYGANLVVVDLTDADAIVVCAGALLAAVAGVLLTTYYCWIQIKGAITLDTAVTGGAAGKSFYLTAVDKVPAVGVAVFDQKAGLSLNATTSVILDCPY